MVGMINKERRTTNVATVGNLIDNSVFSSDQDVILRQLVTPGSKIDLLILGPSISMDIMHNILIVVEPLQKRSSNLVIVSPILHNMSKANVNKSLNKLRKMYVKVQTVKQINVYSLTGKVKYLICHGGQNTMNDALAIEATPIVFGKFVDQIYWSKNAKLDQHQEPNSITDEFPNCIIYQFVVE
jgi:23S rRNA A1618 N6-methylase RlmF